MVGIDPNLRIEIVWCPHCNTKLLVDHDAEFSDGQWRDLTTLHPMPNDQAQPARTERVKQPEP